MFNQIIIAIPAFLIAITLLVAVHEYGHFWVARKLGVKVLRFSIGFGKPLWKKTPMHGETEYVVSALPLGGYVKMLDERYLDAETEEKIPEEELSRAFNRQPIWKRIAILFAGPLANFLFAIGAFYLLFLYGVQDYKPILSPSSSTSPAALAGLKEGDKVQAVNKQAVQSFEELIIKLVDGVITSDLISLEINRAGQVKTIELRVDEEVAKLKEPSELLQGLGIQPWRPDYFPEIASLSNNSPAALAGLAAGDQIKRLDSVEISNLQSFVTEIQKRPGQNINLLVIRDGREIRRSVKIAEKLINGQNTGIIGAALRMPRDSIDSMRTRLRFGPIESFSKACKSTYDMSVLSLKMFREMLKGKVSIKNLSGPISIAQQASYSAQSGLDQFVKFLALISIALGIVNLLPVPMLDGGQIVFNVMELVKGSPVSEQTELIFQQLGIMCIFLIMGLAIYNDIERLLF